MPAHLANLLQQGIEVRTKRTRAGDIVIIPSLYNIVKLLSMTEQYVGRIVYDDFQEKICFVKDTGEWEDIEDHHIESIRFDMEDRLYTTFKKDDIFSAFEIVAKRNKMNPLVDYVKSLEWDGTPRLDRMLIDYFGLKDSVLNEAYARRFMVSIVARMFSTIHNPVKVDTVLVLYGRQGRLKSTALSIIAMDYKFGKKYFSDTPFDMGNKDAHLMTQGKILVELQELAKRSKDKEIEKSFISLQIAEFRPPFKRCRMRFARRCVFAATTNKNMILTDATGSRRFWPVVVGERFADRPDWKIDVDGIRENIEQIWAEAYEAYTNGVQWWLTDTEEELRMLAAADFTDRHPLHERITDIANMLCRNKGYVQVSMIIEKLFENKLNSFDTKYLEKSTRQNKAIISDVLTEEKFQYTRKSVEGKSIRGWFKS